MGLAEIAAAHRRLSILKLLVESNGDANESVLREALAQLGLTAGLTREAVRMDLRFLETAGCIRLEWFDDKLAVAHVLERGADVAAGTIAITGIKKPSFGN
ncbi:MAG TPA: hypothetical protein VGG48_14165 [Rhizomicrobium sp.]|jgi:hypothetical protein